MTDAWRTAKDTKGSRHGLIRHFSAVCLEELSKATKTLRELRRVLPDYKSTALPLQQPDQFNGIAKQFSVFFI
jgi:hypothetical protein